MWKISYASCLGLFTAISMQFTFEMHIAAWNREKFTRTLLFWRFKDQVRSRSSMLTFLRSSSPVLVMISSMSVPICSHFHARQANTGIIIFVEGAPLSPPRSCGPTWLSSINFCAEILESRLSYGENQNSLSHLGLNRYRLMTYGQTNRQTNRITIANTVYAL